MFVSGIKSFHNLIEIVTHKPVNQSMVSIQIRSFFLSTKKGGKIRDEPPFGAEVIEYASKEVRRMAEAKKQYLNLVKCVTILNGNVD